MGEERSTTMMRLKVQRGLRMDTKNELPINWDRLFPQVYPRNWAWKIPRLPTYIMLKIHRLLGDLVTTTPGIEHGSTH